MGWVSILDPARVLAILDVPQHWIFIGYLCVGYPCRRTTRRPLSGKAGSTAIAGRAPSSIADRAHRAEPRQRRGLILCQ
jgi:hypothetical protein